MTLREQVANVDGKSYEEVFDRILNVKSVLGLKMFKHILKNELKWRKIDYDKIQKWINDY